MVGLSDNPFWRTDPPGYDWLAETIPWNSFLGSVNVYKSGLCTISGEWWGYAKTCFPGGAVNVNRVLIIITVTSSIGRSHFQFMILMIYSTIARTGGMSCQMRTLWYRMPLVCILVHFIDERRAVQCLMIQWIVGISCTSAPDPWRFDTVPDPRIRTTRLRIQILLFFLLWLSRCQQKVSFSPPSFFWFLFTSFTKRHFSSPFSAQTSSPPTL